MPDYTTRALVLRRSDYRDYDRMVTLFSPELGRIDAVVYGCKRSKSPLINATEPFCSGEYTIRVTKGRESVTACEITESFYPLREDYDKLIHAAYYLHLAGLVTLPGQPGEALFLLLMRALAILCYGATEPSTVTLAFELHFLSLNGQAPRMHECVRCGRALEGSAVMDVAMGGAACLSCAPDAASISLGARRILMRVPMTRFDVLDKLTGHPNLDEAKDWTRRFLSYHIDAPPRKWPPLRSSEEYA